MDQENIPSLLLFRSPKSGHRRHSYLYELDSNSGVANDGDKKRSIATFSIISSSSSRNNDADNSNSSSQSFNQSNNSTDSNVNRSFKTAKDTFNNSSSGVSSILSKQNSQQQFILHDELVKAEAGDKAHNKSTSSINSNQQPNFIKPILYDSDSSSSHSINNRFNAYDVSKSKKPGIQHLLTKYNNIVSSNSVVPSIVSSNMSASQQSSVELNKIDEEVAMKHSNSFKISKIKDAKAAEDQEVPQAKAIDDSNPSSSTNTYLTSLPNSNGNSIQNSNSFNASVHNDSNTNSHFSSNLNSRILEESSDVHPLPTIPPSALTKNKIPSLKKPKSVQFDQLESKKNDSNIHLIKDQNSEVFQRYSTNDEFFYDEDFLNSIYHQRQRDLEKDIYSDSPGRNIVLYHGHRKPLLFCISFLLPPLFFVIGFGLLDSYIGRTDKSYRRTNLVCGSLELLIVCALIGIGFGLGISLA